MTYRLSEEQREFRDTLRRFFDEHSPEAEVRRLMETGLGYDAATWKLMSEELGLPGLAIDEAYHKTFIAVDEKGTEAAAATAVAMATRALVRPEKPIEVHLDRPFLYAIVDTRTQTALFLGRIVDPR